MPKPLTLWNGTRMDYRFSLEMGQITNWLRRPISLKFPITTLPFKFWCNSWANDCWVYFCHSFVVGCGQWDMRSHDVDNTQVMPFFERKTHAFHFPHQVAWIGSCTQSWDRQSHFKDGRATRKSLGHWHSRATTSSYTAYVYIVWGFLFVAIYVFVLFCLKSLEGFSKNIYFYLFIYLAMPSLSCSTHIFNHRAACSIFSCSLWGLNVEF